MRCTKISASKYFSFRIELKNFDNTYPFYIIFYVFYSLVYFSKKRALQNSTQIRWRNFVVGKFHVKVDIVGENKTFVV